ncbi:MAG: hydroxyacylglutathione hydrolase [Betaproteobacteria bacterium]|nr:hydroxyacylglutathione hydrolase [Betaproteobacteria bacterium]
MLHIEPIPAFRDNYIWLLQRGRYAAVVDPGDAQPVLEALRRKDLTLVAILNTHHHADHVGGNMPLTRIHPVPVYGPARESIPAITHPIDNGDRVQIPQLDLVLSVLGVPGHTLGHIAYYGANSLFCGDTLFGCGCGRLFEGTGAQMHASLTALATLPDDTQVYCAHEYTAANIRFARQVEPDNAALKEREAWVSALRAAGQPTLPSTVGLERRTNPFLRCGEPAVAASAARQAGSTLADPVAVFIALRAWKDRQ